VFVIVNPVFPYPPPTFILSKSAPPDKFKYPKEPVVAVTVPTKVISPSIST